MRTTSPLSARGLADLGQHADAEDHVGHDELGDRARRIRPDHLHWAAFALCC
jgi:hypothetical protein